MDHNDLAKNIRAQLITACLSAIMGIIVIFGWKIHSLAIAQIHPGFATMQFNTALCFVLSGLSLIFISSKLKSASRVTVGILGSLSFVTLLQYLGDFDFGIDLLFNGSAFALQSVHPPDFDTYCRDLVLPS